MKKTFKKIHRAIIHFLGGVTNEENMNLSCMAGLVAEFRRVHRIRTYLDLMNGASAYDWCKQAYDHIKRIEEELKADIPESVLERLNKLPDFNIGEETTNQ